MNIKENLIIPTFSSIDTQILSEKILEDKNKSFLKLEKTIKRIIDIIGATIGIFLMIPLTIIIYSIERIIGDKGSVFYTQTRIGQDGKFFKMYKYRSMVIGAEEKLQQYIEENEEAREEYRKYKKLEKDPRVTKVGRILRKTSLDEFPQFINVLKGEMTLVGPRPYLPQEKEEMNGYFKSITSLKPGVTGLWQISGRSTITFVERLELDMNYYQNKTLKTDLKIIGKTIEQVIKKEGAI
ncbi:MAG: sugar transferase [Clostridia bacterium]|nr:sugar transferase [Clostridia bacterium]